MPIELILLFLVIAFIYASVGFGGGSSYTALLSVYNFPVPSIKLISLICNIIVVSGGSWVYYKNGLLQIKRVLPFVVLSIPLAFLGAYFKLREDVFFILLGISLVVAAILLIGAKQSQMSPNEYKKLPVLGQVLLGGAIGLLSGLVGIGGGIFLSPILHLLKWDNPKVIAATASFFILVNSIAGIIGQFAAPKPNIHAQVVLALAVAVLVGGQLGARLGVFKWPLQTVKRVTAIVILAIGLEILYKHLFV